MSVILHLCIGLIFGLGLVIAGMSDPAKVLNFLDVNAIPAGTWDASLVFVMAGAIFVTMLGFRIVLKAESPILGEKFHLPTANDIDARIIVGPVIFGIGWGLAGFCPGPAFTALGNGAAGPVFVIAMLGGMIAARWLSTRLPSATGQQTAS